MKSAGYLLLTLGFLGGSLIAVQHAANEIAWVWFVPAFLVSVTGVALARMAMHGVSHHEDALSSNIESLHDSIDRIVSNITSLEAKKETLDVYDLHGRIDELFPADLNIFVDARKTIGHVYDLQAYADVMNCFAAGERYLNRVWSCSVDGYIDEAHAYVTRSREQFVEAQAKLGALRASA